MAIEREHHEAEATAGTWQRPRFTTGSTAGRLVALAARVAAAQAGALWLPGEGPLIVLPDTAAAPPRAGAGPMVGPSLVPWLALWLAREGLAVLLHGPGAAHGGGGAAEVLHSLGIAHAADAGDVSDRWARREPAVVSTSALAPGLRPAGLTWRLLAPRGPRLGLRVVPCDTPGSERSTAAWAAHSGAAVLLLAGATPTGSRHCPRAEVWIGGRLRPELGIPATDEPASGWTPLPRDTGAAASALFVQELLSGVRPTPEPLRRLAWLVERAARAALTEHCANTPVSCL